jgi:protoheme IX farnesyltransferase
MNHTMQSVNSVKDSSSTYDGFFRGSSFWAFFLAALPLTKPTISLLVVFTAVPELLSQSAIASYQSLQDGILTSLFTLVGIFLASASSAVFNHVIDADIDLTMQRTRNRPVPSGAVSQKGAIILGTLLGIVSVAILYFGASPLAAVLGLFANIFYAWFYTAVLKRRTDQNIVIGGAAGAIGPLISCAAVSGSLSVGAWLQFLVIFLWTPPHFWALALKYQNDYRLANIPMLPVTRGDEVTRKHILIYTLTLFPVVLLLFIRGDVTIIAGGISLVASAYFTLLAYELWKLKDNTKSMKLFIYSCLYLFIVFGSLTIERLWVIFFRV